GRVVPPDSGVPNGLEPFLNENGVLIQPIIRRRHYLTKDICHMNVARAKRPGNVSGRGVSSPAVAKDDPERCPFGPGKEAMTPRWEGTGSDYVRIGTDPWQVRSFPNLYPWMLDHLNIVETPLHKASSQEVDPNEEALALQVAAQYVQEQELLGRCVVLFRNQGLSASLAHFHWQIGSLSYVPVREAEELSRAEQFHRDHGMNIFDAILDAERRRGERLVGENAAFSVLAPFAPRTNNEIWIILRQAASSLSQISETDRRNLAEILCVSIKGLFAISGNDDLFVIVHQLPPSYRAYRFHVELFPVKPWSGAERGFGELVVEKAPEDTATELREKMKDVF
ncbi:MAG TPA: hypothetical protein PKH07_10375, partial [bacterium]|nr:hypothetical protein [bacterium]